MRLPPRPARLRAREPPAEGLHRGIRRGRGLHRDIRRGRGCSRRRGVRRGASRRRRPRRRPAPAEPPPGTGPVAEAIGAALKVTGDRLARLNGGAVRRRPPRGRRPSGALCSAARSPWRAWKKRGDFYYAVDYLPRSAPGGGRGGRDDRRDGRRGEGRREGRGGPGGDRGRGGPGGGRPGGGPGWRFGGRGPGGPGGGRGPGGDRGRGPGGPGGDRWARLRWPPGDRGGWPGRASRRSGPPREMPKGGQGWMLTRAPGGPPGRDDDRRGGGRRPPPRGARPGGGPGGGTRRLRRRRQAAWRPGRWRPGVAAPAIASRTGRALGRPPVPPRPRPRHGPRPQRGPRPGAAPRSTGRRAGVGPRAPRGDPRRVLPDRRRGPRGVTAARAATGQAPAPITAAADRRRGRTSGAAGGTSPGGRAARRTPLRPHRLPAPMPALSDRAARTRPTPTPNGALPRRDQRQLSRHAGGHPPSGRAALLIWEPERVPCPRDGTSGGEAACVPR
jgi:hypothetical protein